MRSSRHVDLLFNPGWTGLPTYNTPRTEWPSTIRYELRTEVFDYKETILDIEDSFGAAPDRYYRRFQAVRVGKGYR